jgi:hypothetical protein
MLGSFATQAGIKQAANSPTSSMWSQDDET